MTQAQATTCEALIAADAAGTLQVLIHNITDGHIEDGADAAGENPTPTCYVDASLRIVIAGVVVASLPVWAGAHDEDTPFLSEAMGEGGFCGATAYEAKGDEPAEVVIAGATTHGAEASLPAASDAAAEQAADILDGLTGTPISQLLSAARDYAGRVHAERAA